MDELVRRYEKPIIAGFFLVGTCLLFRMCYLPGYISLPLCAVLLLALRAFVKTCYGVVVPLFLLALVWSGVLLDWLGNIFQWYSTRYAYLQYDELTHALVPALVAPSIVWLLAEGLRRFNYHLPLALVTLFAMTTMFTLAGFYEVLELWDDKYMHPNPGWRIHGAYDTANDLQCDLLGMFAGGLLAYGWLKKRDHKQEERASAIA